MVNRSTYDLMLSYSPIDNVKQQPYPNMLAIGGKLRSHPHAQLPRQLDSTLGGNHMPGVRAACVLLFTPSLHDS